MVQFRSGEYSFVALMPNENFSDWLHNLSSEDYFDLIGSTNEREITVGMPKFESDFSYRLSEQLIAMGLAPAFDRFDADFTKIGTAADNIFISEVPHNTYFKIDEKGTIAVAVTMPQLGCASAGPTEVVFNKPFLYAIIENKTSLPLFIGIMNDPTK